MLSRRLLVLMVGSVAAAIATGCEPAERIEHYTVLKPPPIEKPAQAAAEPPPTGEPTDRMLAAVVPHQEQGWFFKLMGKRDAVAPLEGAFHEFLKSIHFGEDGKPKWTVPPGWREEPGSNIRYATLFTGPDDDPAGKPLELTVTVLPKAGDDDEYALVNINRWRGQLRLPPIGKEQLPAESKQVPLASGSATVVDLVGHAQAGGMGRGPFSPGAGDGK